MLLLAAPLVPSAPAQTDFSPEPPPGREYRDHLPRCNANGLDGWIAHDFEYSRVIAGWDYQPNRGLITFETGLRGISGEDGHREWFTPPQFWHKLPGPQLNSGPWYYPPVRFGLPEPYYMRGPAPVDNAQVTSDLTGDGVCDVLYYAWMIRAGNGAGSLALIDGATGAPAWKFPFAWTRNNDNVFTITDFPTGLVSAEGSLGARFAFKLTNLTYNYQTSLWAIQERVFFGNASTGQILWSRQDLITVGTRPTHTYLSGLVPSPPGQELDVAIDSVMFGQGCGGPTTLDARVLRGSDGADAWPAIRYWNDLRLGTSREPLEDLNLCFAGRFLVRPMGDVNGDGRADLIANYMTVTQTRGTVTPGEVETRNSMFRTHFVPIDGAKGTKIWAGKNIIQQGWGFGTDLNTQPLVSRGLVAVGVVDLPVFAGSTRFPPKDVRLTVLNADDGSSAWGTYRDRFGLNSGLIYTQSLRQILHVLAPKDFDGDGVRDLISPARLREPNTQEQLLLSGSGHSYALISGRTGDSISTAYGFGPSGQVIPCKGEGPDQFTIMSGHARRLDVSRVNASDGSIAWRQAIHANRRPQGQTAGIDIVFVVGACLTDGDLHLHGASYGRNSARRGPEIMWLEGARSQNGSLQWVVPKLPDNLVPPDVATLEDYRYPPVTQLAQEDRYAWAGGSVGLGLLTALGIGMPLGRRRWRK